MLKMMTGEAVDTYLHSLSEEEERFIRGNIDTFRTYLTEIEGQNLTEQDKLFLLPNSDRYGSQTCYGDILQILNDHMPQATPDEKNSLKPISRKLKAMLQSSARQQILEFAEQATDFVSKGLYFSLANVMQQCGKLTLDRDTILDSGDDNIERIDGITAEIDRMEQNKEDHIVAYKYWKGRSTLRAVPTRDDVDEQQSRRDLKRARLRGRRVIRHRWIFCTRPVGAIRTLSKARPHRRNRRSEAI